MNNWAGNHQYQSVAQHRPETMAQIQDLVHRSDRVKVLGSRHSFNDIADTTGTHLTLEKLTPVVAIDPARRTVTVDGGSRYGTLCPHLHRAGWALPNLASLPHISVAGACATATHGSGDGNGNLATSVCALDVVSANGDLITLSREQDGESFDGAVVALGGLGVVTSLTLRVIPSFNVRQYVFVDVDLADVFDHFDEVMASAYSVSPFTDWRSGQARVWVKERVAPDDEVEADAGTESRRQMFGVSPSTSPRHPSDDERSASCTEQQGVAGSWHERLPHFRLDHTPSVGAELQSEYFVPRTYAREALRAVHGLREEIAPMLHISEIRSVAADSLWMSPCYEQDCIAIHFTWKLDWQRVRPLLSRIEAVLAPFDPRPHWGKLSTLSAASVQAQYAKLPEFRDLLRHFDPDGKFRNPFLDTLVFSDRTADDRPR